MTAETWALKTEKYPWWVMLIGGVLNIIIGLLLLTVPAKTVFALVLALGIYWIIQGLITLVSMFMDHTAWGWKLFMGLLGIIAGFLILRYPLMATLEIPRLILLLVAFQSMIVGVVTLIMAFQGGGWGAGILGALAIIFGAVLLAHYWSLTAIVGLVWFASIMALVGGVGLIIRAFQQRAE